MSQTIRPALVWANWYYFRPNESITHPVVESLCVLWSARGSGKIWSGEQVFELKPGAALVLPWRHEISYQADSRNPFQLGTLHVVPNHLGEVSDITLGVGLFEGDGLLGSPLRQDSPNNRLSSAQLHDSGSHLARNLILLGNYAIEQLLYGVEDKSLLVALGQLIYHETGAESELAHSVGPSSLRAMKEFMLQNLARPITITDIAKAANCSVSTAERIFRSHEQISPKSWLARARLRHASFLLQSTNLQVAEVAFQVGFSDPLYFSKVFSKSFGVAPSRFGDRDSHLAGEPRLLDFQ